jgi:hypothetical protein
LSYAQQGLWFIDQLGGGKSPEYYIASVLRLRGMLDAKALSEALDTILGRHESLRTHFAEIDGVAVQVIESARHVAFPVDNLCGLEEGAQQAALDDAIRREVETPFDLRSGPLLRVRLLQLGADDHVLVRTVHHIVTDGWSEGVFNRELMVLYDAYLSGRENPLPALPVQYADFTLWQREWLSSGGLESGLAYWTRQLAQCPDQLTLPMDRPRPPVQTFEAERWEQVLPAPLVTGLKRLSRAHGATLYMTLLAAFGVLLARYTGQRDLLVSSPIANRQDAKLEGLIGFFVNTLVLRIWVHPRETFIELLRAVRQTTLDAYRHQDVPFDQLVETLAPARRLNIMPLAQIGFALQGAPGTPSQLAGLNVTRIPRTKYAVRFDLEVYASERDGELSVLWLYNRGLFDQWRIKQMARHYTRLLMAAVDAPDRSLGNLDLIDSFEPP